MNLNQVIVVCALCCTGATSGSKHQARPEVEHDEFSKQVASLVRRLKLPEDRVQAVPSVLRDIQRVLGKRWPGCRAIRFGSSATGEALEHSDIDVFIRLNRTDIDTSTRAIVEEAKTDLQQHPDLFAELITRTVPKVLIPVVSFQHVRTKFNVEMSFKGELVTRNSQLVQYMLHIDERALDLAIIVKYWARLHKVSAAYQCPSSGITLLLIFYLQQVGMMPSVASLQSDADPDIVSGWNAGFKEIDYKPRCNRSMYELLGGFFEYYDNFKFEEYIVSVYKGYPLKRQFFEDLQNVSHAPDLYMRNDVRNNWTQPISCGYVCIQYPFEHSRHYDNYDIRETGPDSTFMTQFKRAALKYRENKKNVFLDEILTIEK